MTEQPLLFCRLRDAAWSLYSRRGRSRKGLSQPREGVESGTPSFARNALFFAYGFTKEDRSRITSTLLLRWFRVTKTTR